MTESNRTEQLSGNKTSWKNNQICSFRDLCYWELVTPWFGLNQDSFLVSVKNERLDNMLFWSVSFMNGTLAEEKKPEQYQSGSWVSVENLK